MPGILTDNMPDELKELITDKLKSLSSLPREEAERVASRSIHDCGWFLTQGGWQKLGPDVSDKVNVRKATEQPDGRYFVPDVDVFYPNAVKGAGEERTYTVKDIRRAIQNTNRGIANGGQLPSLAKGHPMPAVQKMVGFTPPSFGGTFNYRESPRGAGWVRCDIRDIDPDVIDEWGKGRYTGLSAGFVEDANALNMRFGHVALLGVESQALSHLPRTAIFEAGNQVCFSTEPLIGAPPMSKKMQAYSNLSRAFAAMSAAFASAGTGETGYGSKVKEAFSNLKTAQGQFAEASGEDHPDAAQDEALIKEMMEKDKAGPLMCGDRYAGDTPADDEPVDDEPADDDTPFKEEFDSQEPQELTDLPDEPELKSTTDKPDNDLDVKKFDADKVFSAFSRRDRAIREAVNAIIRKVNDLDSHVRGIRSSSRDKDFAAFIDTLKADGHQFDASGVMDRYQKIAGNADAVAVLRDMLRQTPIDPKNVRGATFSAGGDVPAKRPSSKQSSDLHQRAMAVAQAAMPGAVFSTEDGKLADAITRASMVAASE